MILYILNKEEELIGTLSGNAETSASHFFNAYVTKEINKGCQLTFEVDMTDERIPELIKEEYHVVFKDGDAFRLVTIKEIVDIHGEDFIKEIYCEDSSIELYDEVILEEFNKEVSIELDDALNHILKNTRWSIGEVDNVNRIKLKDDYRAKSVLNGLSLIASAFDVEIDFTVSFIGNKIARRSVTMKRQLGRDLGKRIEYQKDIESIKRTVNTGDIKTAVIPFGKQNEETGEYLTIRDVIWTASANGLNKPAGQIYLEDINATNNWGYLDASGGKRPRWIAIEYPEVEDANELIKYANLQLASHKTPSVTYEVEAVDLYKLLDDNDYSFETVEIGDAVGIVDHEFNPPLTLKSRVVKIEENYSATHTERRITLGNVIGSLVDKDIKTQVAELGASVGAVNVDLSGIYDRLESIQNSTSISIAELNKQLEDLLNRPDVDLSDIYEWLERLEGRDDIDKDQLFQWIEQIETQTGLDLTEIRKKVETLQNNVTALDKKTGTGVWSAVSQINQVLFGSASGYHYMSESNGIWVYDKPSNQNPTKAVVLKGGQLGIAKWDTQTQSWKVGTFIDGNMVNASMINTGTLNADRIKAGSITAEKLEISVKNKIANSVTNEEVEAKLTANAEGIKSEVAKTYETKQDVVDKINNIKIGGRNLIIEKDLAKGWVDNTGNVVTDNSYAVTHFIPCSANEKFIFQIWLPNSAKVWYDDTYFDNDKKYIGGYYSTYTTTDHLCVEFTAPQNANYIRVSYAYNKDYKYKLERGTKPTDYTPAPEDVEESVKGVKGELSRFEDTVNTTFKDGVIQEAEATAIKQHLQIIDTVKAEIDKEYSAVYKNTALSTSLKNDLEGIKTAYNNAHTSLKSFINTAIQDGKITESERNSVNSAFTTYNTAVANYRGKIQECLDFISTAKVTNLQVGTRNYVRDYKFRKEDVWAKSNSCATVDTTNSWGKLASRTTATFLSQIMPKGEINNGDTFTLQYEIKTENVQASTGTDSFIIRTQLTGYLDDGTYVTDISIVGKHESEVATLNSNGWTKVVKTVTINTTKTFDYVRLRLYARNFEGNIYFRNIKLERGTKATDLSPAPEDIDAEFENYFTAEQINESLQGLIDQSNEIAEKYQSMITDKTVTPNEKIQLKATYEQIVDKYENAKVLVDAVGNPTITTNFRDLTTAYNSAKAVLEPLFNDMTTITHTDEAGIYAKISDFYGYYEIVVRLVQTALNQTITSVKTEVNQMADGVQTAITNSTEALGVTRTVGKHFDFTADGWVRIYASLNGKRGKFMTQITDQRMSFYDGETEVAYVSNKDLYITDARIINTLHVGNMALEKSAKGGMIFKWKG